MSKIIFLVIVVVGILGGGAMWFMSRAAVPVIPSTPPEKVEVMCTMDAMQCPDGSYIGRTGPNCEFVCPELPAVPADVQAAINAKADLIVLEKPVPLGLIENGVTVAGKARGTWYFEGSFPIVLTDWDGKIIAEGVATAQGEWMTEEFVPFTATLAFVNPYSEGVNEALKNGTLILKKDNPSGLPEHDDALEIPVRFAL